MGRPTIDIIFKQLSASIFKRSARGIVALIVRDDTNKAFKTKEYKQTTDVETALFTAANAQLINDCFFGTPLKVIVIRIDVAANISEALVIAGGQKIDYLGSALPQADQTAIGIWVKGQAALKKTVKGVTWGNVIADSESVINLMNTNVVFNDSRGSKTGEQYVPSLLGIMAGCPLNKSTTYTKCTNLVSATEPADIDASIDAGNLVLMNEDGVVKIAAGVNTLVTLTADKTEDMKQISFIETMHMIKNDTVATFKEWIGNYKNKYDNQVLFIAGLRSYYNDLEKLDVLDPNYNNTADVNVVAQKAAWVSAGKDVSAWDDQTTKNNTFKRSMFLLSDLKILGAIENLSDQINLF